VLGPPALRRPALVLALLALLTFSTLLPAGTGFAGRAEAPDGGHAISATPAIGLPALPVRPEAPRPSSTHVDPFAYISSEPAPMGIADFGVTGVEGAVDAYSYATTVFQGDVRVDSMLTYGAGVSTMSFQLNTVIVLSSGGTNYSYWVQNVASVDSSNQGIGWVDNIWNLSSPTAALKAGEITGNGTVSNYPGLSWYWDSPGGTYPGNQITLAYPTNLSVRSIVSTVGGYPRVGFTYNDGYGWVTYDNVTFTHARGWTNHGFVVDGYAYTPLGVFYDAEWDYAGSTTGQHNLHSNLTMSLRYWNGHNYQSTPNAWNFGGNTAESLDNVISSLGPSPPNGSLSAHVVNGSGSLGLLYNASQVGTLVVTTGTVTNGTVRINGSPYEYRGGGANFTLAPGDYTVELDDGGTFVGAGNVTIGAGATAHLALPFPRQTITFQETGLPAGTAWSVRVGSTVLPATGATVATTEKDGSYTYALANVPGYRTHPYDGSFTVIGGPVTILVAFWTANYTVDFTAYGLPAGTPWSVIVGGSEVDATGPVASIDVPNGTYDYATSTVNLFIGAPDNGSIVVVGFPVFVDVLFGIHLGSLQGTVEPAAASVWIDGRLTNSTLGWFNLPLPPGLHTVQAQSVGYEPYAANITVTPGNASSIAITMTQLPPSSGGSRASSQNLLSTTSLVWLGIAVAATAAILGGIAWAARRRRR